MLPHRVTELAAVVPRDAILLPIAGAIMTRWSTAVGNAADDALVHEPPISDRESDKSQHHQDYGAARPKRTPQKHAALVAAVPDREPAPTNRSMGRSPVRYVHTDMIGAHPNRHSADQIPRAIWPAKPPPAASMIHCSTPLV
ncbi:Uncharacterised protein [Mycobacteroides abscessus subsp. bolletii]|nr:Uncharacterised protein [Mycobacteroides abscessus subsp. bolletii]SHX90120.1 Uncharacterised protein [Mycobacteroides abscessus subsp. bolletii]SKS43588.1 Uncharacterised protein [Mycobacteroides abscessus subsp. bolletii]SKS54729.1 Uncharacterised protein [Mycobacteroides abscessus subsp. bolletii]SKV26669.1 Uncharacterised protein [Mycobacteroides abscessus subsp. bolletii]